MVYLYFLTLFIFIFSVTNVYLLYFASFFFTNICNLECDSFVMLIVMCRVKCVLFKDDVCDVSRERVMYRIKQLSYSRMHQQPGYLNFPITQESPFLTH